MKSHTTKTRSTYRKVVFAGLSAAWIANHAEDKILIFDTTFLPIVEAVKDHLKTVKTFVIFAGADDMPENTFSAIAFDEWISGKPMTGRLHAS